MNSTAYTAHLSVHVYECIHAQIAYMHAQFYLYILRPSLLYLSYCEVVGIKHVRHRMCIYMIVTAILLLQVSHVCIVTTILYLPIGFQQFPPLDFPPYSRFNLSNNSLACSSKSMFLLITLELLVQIDILCSSSSSYELSLDLYK